MTDTLPDFFCSAVSVEAGEQLFGSAPSNNVWFLLEYTRPWGAKVLPESDLPQSVKTTIEGHLKAIPKSNILFIKQQFKQVEGIRFYVALTRESDPLLYEFHLESYDDLLKLDIPAIASGDAAYQSHLTTEPLYLVCTNTKRDRCCAKFGVPIYKAMVEQAGSRVWQCSHIGGHRFAPTCLFFPHGLNYGRFTPAEVPAMIDDYIHGKIDLEHSRGRVCYDGTIQAADHFLRAEIGARAIDELKLLGIETMENDSWLVQFTSQAENTTYNVHVQKLMTEVETFTSCNATDQVPLWKYRLLAQSSLPNPT